MRFVALLVGIGLAVTAFLGVLYGALLLLPPGLAAVVAVTVIGLAGLAIVRRSPPYESAHGAEDLRRADDGYRGPNDETGAGWL